MRGLRGAVGWPCNSQCWLTAEFTSAQNPSSHCRILSFPRCKFGGAWLGSGLVPRDARDLVPPLRALTPRFGPMEPAWGLHRELSPGGPRSDLVGPGGRSASAAFIAGSSIRLALSTFVSFSRPLSLSLCPDQAEISLNAKG